MNSVVGFVFSCLLFGAVLGVSAQSDNVTTIPLNITISSPGSNYNVSQGGNLLITWTSQTNNASILADIYLSNVNWTSAGSVQIKTAVSTTNSSLSYTIPTTSSAVPAGSGYFVLFQAQIDNVTIATANSTVFTITAGNSSNSTPSATPSPVPAVPSSAFQFSVTQLLPALAFVGSVIAFLS